MKTAVLLVCLCVLTLSQGCDEPDRKFLEGSYWQLADIQTIPALLSAGAAMEQIRKCEKDDAWRFEFNGILRNYGGSQLCNLREASTTVVGGWHLSNNEEWLTIREAAGMTTSYEVLELTDEKLRLRYHADETTVELRYKNIPAKLLAQQ